MSKEAKAIGLTCVDPRMIPEATRKAIVEKYDLDPSKVYLKTDPGIVALIANDEKSCAYIVEQVGKMVALGHVEKIVSCGHQDCKANVVPDEVQLQQIRRSLEILSQAFPTISCNGVFLEKDPESEYGWKPVWL